MVDAQKAVTLVVALVVGGLMASFLVPIAVDNMSGDSTVTLNQSVGDTDELTPDLNATLDSTTNTSATYTINASGDTASTTVNEGENSTVTVDGVDVNIAVENATTTNATSTFSYPTTYGWGGGASALWAILPVMIVLAIFLFFVGMALKEL